MNDRRSAWLLIAPALLLVGVIYFLPLARVLAISVLEPEPGLGNYALLFTSAPIQRVLGTTLRICLFTTSITLVLAYVVAYVLTHAKPTAQRLMMLGVLLPLWMSVLVRAFAWVTLLRRQGLVNNALIGMGAIDESLALMWNEIGVTIGMVHYMLPLGILPLWAAMRDIDGRVLAASRGLGASATQTFVRVFLPLSLPGVIGAGLLVFIFSLGFFITPAILGGGRVITIGLLIEQQVRQFLDWPFAAALSALLLAAALLIQGTFQRVLRGETRWH